MDTCIKDRAMVEHVRMYLALYQNCVRCLFDKAAPFTA